MEQCIICGEEFEPYSRLNEAGEEIIEYDFCSVACATQFDDDREDF